MRPGGLIWHGTNTQINNNECISGGKKIVGDIRQSPSYSKVTKYESHAEENKI